MTRITGDWLQAAPTQAMFELLEGGGHQAFVVGGCVRNALLGTPVTDIDIATDARPERVMALAADAEMKAIPTGIDHGTVTVVLDDAPHEITTFRRDVETDGRRAVVAFAETMDEDAHRRDFTMNALYADRTGLVHDPVGGLPDLAARHIRFIDDAERRIREDYLRILRFFRFHAWYGHPEEGFDPEGLHAAAALAEGLDTLSRERVGAEIRKLLAAPDPAPSVAAMAQTGVLSRVIPGADPTAMPILVHLEGALAPDPMRRLAVLADQPLAEALRLSRNDGRRYALMATAARDGTSAGTLGYRHGADVARDILIVRAALLGGALDGEDLARARRGAVARFPVTARDLMPELTGTALGARLDELEARWIASDFTLTRDELLA